MKKRIFIMSFIFFAFILLMNSCKSNQFEIKFYNNDGSLIETQIVKKGKKVEKPEDPIKEGYVFLYWELDGAKYDFSLKVSKDLLLMARWEKVPVKRIITYNLYEGSLPEGAPTYYYEGTPLILPIPKKENYKFLGWSFSNSFSEYVTEISSNQIGDITLYAHWQEIVDDSKYGTITYYLYDGINSSDAPTSYEFGQIVKLPIPEKEGYEFLGWTLTSDSTNYIFEISANQKGNIILHANWKPQLTMSEIKYQLDGGTNPANAVSKYQEGKQTILPIPEKDGYTFLGWSLKAGSTSYINEISASQKGDITLYANWEKIQTINEFLVTFIIDEETDNIVVKVKENETVSKPVDPVKEGYEFIGWFKNNVLWDFDNNIVNSDIQLTAKWEKVSQGLMYELIEDGYKCVGIGTCYDKNIVIPSIYNDLPVVSISDYCFAEYEGIESIVIPNTVKQIGYAAFKNCNNLMSITLPFIGNTLNGTSNTHFGYIFGASSYSHNIVDVPRSLKTVVITNEKIIKMYAFSKCINLTRIDISDTVTSIEASAFLQCENLKIVDMGNNITRIGETAFKDCWSLFDFVIPNKMTEIESGVFQNCFNLSSLVIPKSIKNIKSGAFTHSNMETVYYTGNIEDWCNIKFASEYSNPMACSKYFKMKNSDDDYYEVTEIEIPDTIFSIGNYQFYGLKNVKKIIIPSSVTKIEKSAFEECDGLESITLPFIGNILNDTTNGHFGYIFGSKSYEDNNDSVPSSLKEVKITSTNYLNDYCFYGLQSLERIIIGSDLYDIGTHPFENCINLREIIIENDVLVFCDDFRYAFKGCNNIQYNIYDNAKYLGNDSNPYLVLISATNRLIKSIEINPNTKIIASFAFYMNSLEKVEIPNGVTNIGQYAFAQSRITKILLPNSVTNIGIGAFSECTELESIEIPNGITKIEKSLFYRCSSLKTVSIPNGVVSIGPIAFYRCTNLRNIELPNSLKSIGYESFSGCSRLTTILISENITTIEGEVFRDCESLVIYCEILFKPSGWANSWNYDDRPVYWGVNELNFYEENDIQYILDIKNTTATITRFLVNGSSAIINGKININGEIYKVTNIGDKGFYNCDNLENLYFSGSIEDWCCLKFNAYEYNPMYYAEHFFLKNASDEYFEVTEIEIPSTITNIGDYQFAGFENATKIVIPNSVTSIGTCAFKECSKLESIMLPFVGNKLNGTTNTHFGYIFGASSYENHFLYVPSSLKEVKITGGKSVSKNAFRGCNNLLNVEISNSVTSIGISAFEGCNNLESIILPTITQLGSLFGATVRIPTSLKKVTITESINIMKYAFKGCNSLVTIELLDGVKNIGYGAFSECSNLVNIVIGNNVESIGEFAFNECVSLLNVNLPDSVKQIDSYAFNNCTNLKTITIGNNVETTGEFLFEGCENLEYNIYENLQYLGNDQNPYVILASVLDKETDEYIIHNQTELILDYVFCGYSNLKSIYIPNKIRKIGDNSFLSCPSLENVYYNGTIEDWCKIQFVSIYSNPMDNAKHFFMKNANNEYYEVTTIEIPDTVDSIGPSQFYSFDNIKELIVSNNVTSIGRSAFQYCSNLEKVKLGSGITNIENFAFYGCSSLKSIKLLNNISSIREGAFKACESVAIYCEAPTKPSGWSSNWTDLYESVYWNINDSNFYEENGIQYVLNAEKNEATITKYLEDDDNVILNDSIIVNEKEYTITNIGSLSFYECTRLTSIIMPDSVVSIGSYAFAECRGLKNIIIPSNVVSIGEYAFYVCGSMLNVTLPSSIISIGVSAFSYCVGLEDVYYNGEIENWCNIQFESDDSNPMYYAEHFYTKNSDNEYYEITEIIIPDNLTRIGYNQFYGFDNLIKVIIPISIEEIGEYAFSNCNNLTIYCEAESECDDWSVIWKDNDTIVVWGYKEE